MFALSSVLSYAHYGSTTQTQPEIPPAVTVGIGGGVTRRKYPVLHLADAPLLPVVHGWLHASIYLTVSMRCGGRVSWPPVKGKLYSGLTIDAKMRGTGTRLYPPLTEEEVIELVAIFLEA